MSHKKEINQAAAMPLPRSLGLLAFVSCLILVGMSYMSKDPGNLSQTGKIAPQPSAQPWAWQGVKLQLNGLTLSVTDAVNHYVEQGRILQQV